MPTHATNPDGQQILIHLQDVARQRALRAADPALQLRTWRVKEFQHRRFTRTYQDMLDHPRYARAAQFFLNELYGPHDFSERDDQLVRVVPALVRLFPPEIVSTVRALAELHALSEDLDSAMATALLVHREGEPLPATVYAAAWLEVGRLVDRDRQVELMLGVGHALDRLTRKPLLRQSLRLMRVPARASGLGALQQLLESGFDTFRAMRGAETFLATTAERERYLAGELFSGRLPAGLNDDMRDRGE